MQRGHLHGDRVTHCVHHRHHHSDGRRGAAVDQTSAQFDARRATVPCVHRGLHAVDALWNAARAGRLVRAGESGLEIGGRRTTSSPTPGSDAAGTPVRGLGTPAARCAWILSMLEPGTGDLMAERVHTYPMLPWDAHATAALAASSGAAGAPPHRGIYSCSLTLSQACLTLERGSGQRTGPAQHLG